MRTEGEYTVAWDLPPVDVNGLPYLILEIGDRSLVEFDLRILYQDGTEDLVPFRRSTLILNDGRFQLSLKPISSPIESIVLLPKSVSSDADYTVEVTLCAAPGL